MRRILVFLATMVTGVLVASGVALAAVVSEVEPNDGKHDFVVGGFQDSEFNLNWGVSAHSGPLGEDPLGYVSATAPLAKANTDEKQGRWRVTCVNVAGKLAAIGGVPTQAASNDADPALFVFRDGGPGGGTPVEPDGFEFLPGRIGDPSACPDPSLLVRAAGAPPIESGNILVHDAQP
jgi:hypothetical protein